MMVKRVINQEINSCLIFGIENNMLHMGNKHLKFEVLYFLFEVLYFVVLNFVLN